MAHATLSVYPFVTLIPDALHAAPWIPCAPTPAMGGSRRSWTGLLFGAGLSLLLAASEPRAAPPEQRQGSAPEQPPEQRRSSASPPCCCCCCWLELRAVSRSPGVRWSRAICALKKASEEVNPTRARTHARPRKKRSSVDTLAAS